MDPAARALIEFARLSEEISERLSRTGDETEVLLGLVDVFRRSTTYDAHVLRVDSDSTFLGFGGSSFAEERLRTGEIAAGVSRDEVRVPLERAPWLSRCTVDGEIIRTRTRDVLAELLPSDKAPRVLRALSCEDHDAVLVPLRRRNRTVALLIITSRRVAELLVPSILSLARHVGTVLDLVETERRRCEMQSVFGGLIDDLDEAVFAADRRGRLTYVSCAVAQFGYEPDELVGAALDGLFAPEGASNGRGVFDELIAGDAVATKSIRRLVMKDGTTRWVRVSSRALTEEDRVVGVRGSISDVTEFQEAGRALRESERRLSTLMANLPGMAYRCVNDRDWTMSFVSEGVRELTGYAVEDLVDNRVRSYASLIVEEDRDSVWESVQDALRTRSPFTLVYRIRAADGEIRWVWEQGRGVYGEAGDLTALEGFITDISERKRALDALRRSENRLSLALDATSEGLWDWDVDSGGAYFSPRYYTMLGYEPNAFEASYASWLKLLHPEDRGRAQEAIRERMRDENGAFEIEFRMRTADGSWRWILSRGRVVERHPDGRPLRMIGTHADVTSRHDAERALQRAFDGAIEAMARTTETRDPYTAGHQQRVTQLSCAIARELELDDRDISTLRIAGLLHDIGKISVPSEILAKPVRLSEPEFDMVRGHVESGYEILRRIEFPWPIADIVRQHHERLDGSGYPLGLRKDEIRPEARILAVADVVEAMATHRPYRAALGVEAALAEIERGAGDLFDPDVVAACLRLFRERSFTFDEAATDAR